MNLLDRNNYPLKNNKSYRYILDGNDKFPHCGWTVALIKKNA